MSIPVSAVTSQFFISSCGICEHSSQCAAVAHRNPPHRGKPRRSGRWKGSAQGPCSLCRRGIHWLLSSARALQNMLLPSSDEAGGGSFDHRAPSLHPSWQGTHTNCFLTCFPAAHCPSLPHSSSATRPTHAPTSLPLPLHGLDLHPSSPLEMQTKTLLPNLGLTRTSGLTSAGAKAPTTFSSHDSRPSPLISATLSHIRHQHPSQSISFKPL